jgi:hypothetical protein
MFAPGLTPEEFASLYILFEKGKALFLDNWIFSHIDKASLRGIYARQILAADT